MRYRRHKPVRADNATTQVKTRHTRPSIATSTTKMFPRNLLLILLLTCALFCCSYAQTDKEETQEKSPLDDWVIVSTSMVCTMFFVLIVLIPTVMYYRYFHKIEIETAG
ncbi:PREDICTED: uncharacterized protein LOC105453895 [Wasmannia auropunctata]|uniref:uncharacterized protein LOC105453895 n=1 Tax=Wasmannia auropunctata TaxID=64793 RepID=UPI0005EFBE5F|nr:PREDICTED: uncharacterized protein LOC105453895 [Wasmannia auropunctata]